MEKKIIIPLGRVVLPVVLLSFHVLSYGVIAYIPQRLRECVNVVHEVAEKSDNTKALEELYSIITENRMLACDNTMRKAVQEILTILDNNKNIFRHKGQVEAARGYLKKYLNSLDVISVMLSVQGDTACRTSWPTSLVARSLNEYAIATDMMRLSSELTFMRNVPLCGNIDIDFASPYSLIASVQARGSKSIKPNHSTDPGVPFNANMMNNSVLTTPSMIFGTGVASPSINAWAMSPSASVQSPINMQFAIPADLRTEKAVSLQLHFLVKTNSVPNGNARIRVNAEYMHNNAEFDISDPVPTFMHTTDSHDFLITEPSSANNVVHVYVVIPLEKSGILNRDFASLSLTRIAPTSGTEYSEDIYLAAAVFQYTPKK
jgi:predicted RNA binding protein with dsRBD fold (UPF0201 family)